MPQGPGQDKNPRKRRPGAPGGLRGASSRQRPVARPANRLSAARAGDTTIIKIIGLGSVNNAGSLWDFVSQEIEDGCRRFALELSECRGLDSTFLGTVVGISQEAREAAGGENGWVCVVNASEANKELFEIVGADQYVRFKPSVEMKPLETEPLATGVMSTEKRLELVRQAHENLISIDRRNEARFGEFLRCLAAELDLQDSDEVDCAGDSANG